MELRGTTDVEASNGKEITENGIRYTPSSEKLEMVDMYADVRKLNRSQSDLLVHDIQEKDESTFANRLPKCNGTCISKFFLSLFPFINIMKSYSLKKDLISDIVAGLIVGFMQIPQGLAYALLANLPPVYGLYTSVWPPLLYFFFGTSKHVSLGSFAITSIMLSKPVNQYCTGNDTVIENDMLLQMNDTMSDLDLCKVGIGTTVALMSGVLLLVLGIAQMGWIGIYLSKPLTSAFTTAAAVHVITSQLKTILGVSVKSNSMHWKIIYDYIELFTNIKQTNIATLVSTVAFIIFLYLLKDYFSPWFKKKLTYSFPSELLVVILGTVLSMYVYPSKWNMAVVGEIPSGFPIPQIPGKFDEFFNLIPITIMISVVAYANTLSIAKQFATKHSYEVNANQEFIASGIGNTVCSFLSCFISAPSLSRSAVFESSGARTQIAGVISSLVIVVVLLWAGPLFEKLPKGILACIIVVGIKNMLKQFADIKYLWNIDKIDLSIWIVTFLSTIFFNVDYGLIVGLAYNLLTVVYRSQNPHTALLGRLSNSEIYENVKDYYYVKEVEGIKIFRLDSSLFFANKDHFLKKLYKRIGCNPQAVKVDVKELDKGAPFTVSNNALSSFYALVIDCSMMSFIDSVGISVLDNIFNEFEKIDVKVYLSGCHGRVKNTLKSAKFFTKCNRRILYLSNHDAITDIHNTHACANQTYKNCENDQNEDLVNDIRL